MTAVRGDCVDCQGNYALRGDGLVRVHGITSRGPCTGSMRPPAARTPAAPAPIAVPARPLPPEVQACAHEWSGWTRLPTRSGEDFRRCEHCGHVELQPRQPCVLCADPDARAFDVPDYGTAYVCAPCIDGLG